MYGVKKKNILAIFVILIVSTVIIITLIAATGNSIKDLFSVSVGSKVDLSKDFLPDMKDYVDYLQDIPLYSQYTWEPDGLAHKDVALNKQWSKISFLPHETLSPYYLVSKRIKWHHTDEVDNTPSEYLFNVINDDGGAAEGVITYYWFSNGKSTLRSEEDIKGFISPINSEQKAVALAYFNKYTASVVSDKWIPRGEFIQVADGYLVHLTVLHKSSCIGQLKSVVDQIVHVSNKGDVDTVAQHTTKPKYSGCIMI